MAEAQVLFPGLQDEKARATVRLCRPFRVEDPVEAAYLAVREAYVEALARRAGLEVARDSDLTGDAVYVWVTGDPVRIVDFLKKLAEAGIGGLTVGLECPGGGGSCVAETMRELGFKVGVLEEGGVPMELCVRFQNEQRSKTYGPYPFVQLTYQFLRVGPNGDDLAWFDAKAGVWRCGGEEWTDVAVFPR